MRILGISILLFGLAPALHAEWPPVFRVANIDVLPSGALSYPAAVSLRLDARGRPHIAYKAYDGQVRYASCPADRWQVETAYGNAERTCSLLLDSEGSPWILFIGGLLQRTGNGWTEHRHPFYTPPDHLGGVMAADGTVHACFMQSWSGGMYYGTTEYVRYQNGQWDEGAGEMEDAFTHPNAVISMCLDSAGVPRLAVTNTSMTHDPEIRYWPNAETFRPVLRFPHAILGSMAVDAQDRPHLAYYDTQAQDLEYAVFRDGAWDITPVDTDGDVGMYASLALDHNGGVHVAYYDRTSQDLGYASRSASTSQWTTCVVDSAGDVGSWASLDVDAQGLVHIAYFGRASSYARYVLKYATTSPVVAVAPRSWSTVKSAYH